jgi:hypothetical protein
VKRVASWRLMRRKRMSPLVPRRSSRAAANKEMQLTIGSTAQPTAVQSGVIIRYFEPCRAALPLATDL